MKNPAVLWYPSDFISSTSFWTNEQCGAYIKLLNYQFVLGHLKIEQINQITNDEEVISKFIKDKKGLYYNKRMELEIENRIKYSESRSKNKKGKTKDIKIISKSYDNHMGNENINININDNIKEDKDIYSYIENGIGRTLNAIEYEMISSWEDNKLTRYIIKETLAKDIKNIKYINKIIIDYKSKGITTIEQIPKYGRVEVKEPKWLNQKIESEEVTQEEKEVMEELLKEFKK